MRNPDVMGGGAGGKSARVIGKVALYVSVILSLVVTLDRLRRPAGEKLLFDHLGGSADLFMPFNGARAVLGHIDPYGPLVEALQDPSGWPMVYPPTMLALYEPLVLVTSSNIERAFKVFYWGNLLVLGVLVFVVWRLGGELTDALRARKGSFTGILVPLTLSVQTMFALDRAQCEIISATLLWAGVLLFIRRRHAAAIALVTTAAALKGYAVPVVLGLLVAVPNWKTFFRGVASAAAVTLAVTIPVFPYLRQGFKAMLTRVDYLFQPVWWNHSFKATFYSLSPELSDRGRRWMLLLAAGVAGVALFRLIVAARRGPRVELALRAILFTVAAEALMIGSPVFSAPYNLLLIMPGVLLIGAYYFDVWRILRLSASASMAIGIVMILAVASTLWVRWGSDSDVSLAGWALVAFVLCVGGLSAAGGRLRKREVVTSSSSAGVAPEPELPDALRSYATTDS